MDSITQDMKYRQSVVNWANRCGVSSAARKFNKSPSFIYFWLNRYDGSIGSLANRSRRPHSHPNQHTEAEIKLILDMRRRNPNLGLAELWFRLRKRGYKRCIESLYRVMRRLGLMKGRDKKERKKYKPKPYEQMRYPGERIQIDVKVVPKSCVASRLEGLKLYQFTAIDEYSRLRFLGACDEQSTYTAAQFLLEAHRFFKRHGVSVQCVQTDNGIGFTNRFVRSQRDLPTLFEKTAARLGIRHKLIRPYTPRHNGKVERSHREDQKRFYDTRTFHSREDFTKQLKAHQRRTNDIPMRPLGWLSPKEKLEAFHNINLQYV